MEFLFKERVGVLTDTVPRGIAVQQALVAGFYRRDGTGPLAVEIQSFADVADVFCPAQKDRRCSEILIESGREANDVEKLACDQLCADVHRAVLGGIFHDIRPTGIGKIDGAYILLSAVVPEGDIVRHHAVGIVPPRSLIHFLEHIPADIVVGIDEREIFSAGFADTVIARVAQTAVRNGERADAVGIPIHIVVDDPLRPVR